MQHREAKPVYDKGDPIYYPCEKCVIFKLQTIVDIKPIKCEHDLTIGFEYVLECDSPCRFHNKMKKIQVYPC